MLIADIKEREQTGIATYGNALQTFNGRKPLVDMYQEILDAAVYTKQHLLEDHHRLLLVKRLRHVLHSGDYSFAMEVVDELLSTFGVTE